MNLAFFLCCISKENLVTIHAVRSCVVLALASVFFDRIDITGGCGSMAINLCGSKLKSIDTGFITWYHKHIRWYQNLVS